MDMAVFSPFIQVRIYFGYGHTFISTLGIEELRNLLFNKLIFQSADSSTRLLTHWIIDNSIDKHNNRSAVPKISILNALFAGLTIKSFANIQSNHSDFQMFASLDRIKYLYFRIFPLVFLLLFWCRADESHNFCGKKPIQHSKQSVIICRMFT